MHDESATHLPISLPCDTDVDAQSYDVNALSC